MKQNLIYAIMALIIIGAFGYMAYGEDAIPTPKDIALQQRARLLEEQSQIDRDNLKILSYCNEYASGAKADERQKAQYDCYRTQRIPDIDIPDLSTGTASGGAISTVPERKQTKQINLRSILSLGDCRFTNDNHKLPRYKLEWLAYDIACEKGKAFDVSVPDYQAKENRKWIVEKIGYGNNIGNFIIIKSNTLRVVYGHTKPIEGIKEGDIVKSTFTIGETDLSGESTGIHLHLEIWEGYKVVSRERFLSETYESTDQTKLLSHRNWNFDNKYYFTHYDLGDTVQNDGAPCTGASGKDLCQMEKNGIKTMAITSDIRKLMGIKFGDTVTLVGDAGCAGTYSVQDEMNKRYRQTPGIKRPGTPYYIKGDIPSKEGGACYIIK